ncbi:MAG: 16S rRNA (guanine(527)-N(7))-methyltransferase RsmG [Clostridiales bacterium]|nr:16S rRNA (guanine(527)-N(7))-methyltransferase RsmG [Clostridiales bacterium]
MINKKFLIKEAAAAGIRIDDQAARRFDIFAEMLVEKNKAVNLTAITDPDEIVVKHFIDSLTVLNALDLKKNSDIIDIGCGAGFPGLPLLIARPDLNFTFLDSVGKKLEFIKEALHEFKFSANVIHGRAEEIGKSANYREAYDYAVTRAVAPLNLLAEYCIPFIKTGGIYVSMKGAKSEVEIGGSAINALGGKIEDVVYKKLPNGNERNLIIVRKISQTSAQYPRKQKQIKSNPL